jgi:tetratricopeptide (TPR) repeat protein
MRPRHAPNRSTKIPAPPEKETSIESGEPETDPGATKPAVPPKPAPKPTTPRTPAATVPAAEQNLFDYATMVYGRKEYDLAATQYAQYLTTYPRGTYSQIALYRLAESQLNLGQTLEAEATYRQLIQRYRTGDYVANAAYRLGSLAYNRKVFETAARDSRWPPAKANRKKSASPPFITRPAPLRTEPAQGGLRRIRTPRQIQTNNAVLGPRPDPDGPC